MKSKELPTIAKNIKKYREKLGISQDKLSKLADVAYNVIIKIEFGATPNPTIETMAKIAKGLGVAVDDLLKQ
ncbi:helix-turn-helix domain-containing protein [Patescibacteria group bacterium]|nr:helix-turn-helix domain-containing protein [Patescibacteria group bacterium]